MSGPRTVGGWIVAGMLLVAATSAGAVDETARRLLPDEYRQKGVLIAGLPLDFEPWNYFDEKNEQVGLDVDVIRAVADTLGLKPEIQRLGFASIIPAITGGRVDIGMFGILEVRLKQVSYVRYTQLANGLIVRKGNPTGITNVSACGHSVAVEKGTQPVLVWENQAKLCEAAGKPKLELMVFDGKGPQVLAIETGRADGAGVTLATAVIAAKHSNGKLEPAPGGPVPGASIDGGIAMRKDNKQLALAIEAAMKVVHASGTYDQIFAKWGLSDSKASPAIFE
jgi:polar amino acid transport system substrate-binding protein